MSKVFLRFGGNEKIVSGPPPGQIGPLVADTEATGLYQECEILVKDSTGALVPVDFTPHPPQPTPPNPTPIPPQNGDAVDLQTAVFTEESPEYVKDWPITAKFTSIGLSHTSDATIDFTKMKNPGAWPYVINMEGGEIQYTLWVGCFISGKWYFAGCIQCIYRDSTGNYVPTGPTLQPGQLPSNWYYYAGNPLAHYQPKPNETVAWFLTQGTQRRDDRHVVEERTNVIITPFAPDTYVF